MSCSDIAENFGTPVFVTSERRIRENYRRIHSAFASNRKKFRLHYALKANNNLSIIRILVSEGAGADCSGPAEIFLAKLSGFSSAEILYSGNFNSDSELEYALRSGCIINLDDAPLLDRLIAYGDPSIISFRINPGVGKGKYEGIVTAGPDAKFGMREQEAVSAYRHAKKAGIRRFGLHMMTGSNVLDAEYFPIVSEKLMGIASRISSELGIEFEFIDIGGGFGVPYQPGEEQLPIEEIAASVVTVFEESLSSNSKMGDPTLVVEPGRYLVCDSTVLLSTVTHVKRSYKTFIGCDAGMNTLLRPALYGAYHEALLANRLGLKKSMVANITGQICENSDMMAKDRNMPEASPGDILAFLNAGAYGFSMSSRYNTRPMAAEVLVSDGKAEIIREREEFTDLILRQRIPSHLL
jgi:diaminopimelate decarboxylase